MERDAGGFVPTASKAVIPLMQTVFLAKNIIGVKDIEAVEAHINTESMSRHVDSLWLNGNYEIAFDYHGIEGSGLYKNRVKLPLKAELPKWWQGGNEENLLIEVSNPQLQVLAPFVLEFSGEIIVQDKEPSRVNPALNNTQKNEALSEQFPLPEISEIQIETRNEVYIETRPDLVSPDLSLDQNLEFDRFDFRQDMTFESEAARSIADNNPGPMDKTVAQVLEVMPYDPSTEISEAVEAKVKDLGFEPKGVEVIDMRSLKDKAMKKIQSDNAKDQGIAVLMQVKPQAKQPAVDKEQAKADILSKARDKAAESEPAKQQEVIAKVEAAPAGEVAVENEIKPEAMATPVMSEIAVEAPAKVEASQPVIDETEISQPTIVEAEAETEVSEPVVAEVIEEVPVVETMTEETGIEAEMDAEMAVAEESESDNMAEQVVAEAAEVVAAPKVLAAKINMLNTDVMGERLRQRSSGGTYTMTFSFAPKVEEPVAPVAPAN